MRPVLAWIYAALKVWWGWLPSSAVAALMGYGQNILGWHISPKITSQCSCSGLSTLSTKLGGRNGLKIGMDRRLSSRSNALKIQLWTALITMLPVKYLQLRSTFGWSLSNLVALLRQQLFVYRDYGHGSTIPSNHRRSQAVRQSSWRCSWPKWVNELDSSD